MEGEWVNECMEGWIMNEWEDKWKDEWVNEYMEEWVKDEWKAKWVDEWVWWVNELLNIWMDE